MSYLSYIVAAYAVFAVVLAWDGLTPWLKHRRLLRSIRRNAVRATQGRANVANAGNAGATE